MDKMKNSFYDELLGDINKLVGDLKDENELIKILKKRLTKKEFRYYKLKVENATTKDMIKELGVDNERFEEIETQTIHKLNQEKIKQELTLS